MAQSFLLLVLIFCLPTLAKVEALFHPTDPTLERIAVDIKNAQQTIDIAMYNIDVTDRNPVMTAFKSAEVQERLHNGQLKIRILLNLSAEGEANAKKKLVLQELGIEVGTLSKGAEVHHKFAIFDYGTALEKMVTGSANWSMPSRHGYDENMVFLSDEPVTTGLYQKEFNKLWSALRGPRTAANENPAFFNSVHFNVSSKRVSICKSCETFTLTRKLVEAIDSAQSELLIATSRVRLPAFYEALQRAASRGVKIKLLISMDSYSLPWNRVYKPLPCTDVYNPKCAVGAPYALYLETQKFAGKENIQLRIKYYDFRSNNYLKSQMHSKYVVVDSKKVFTGSFNWSYSAEYKFLENILRVDDPTAVKEFEDNFAKIFEQGRDNLSEVNSRLNEALAKNEKVQCDFTPISMRLGEVDSFYTRIRKAKRTVKTLCL